MSEISAKYGEGSKKDTAKLSYDSPKKVSQVAQDLGIKENRVMRERSC